MTRVSKDSYTSTPHRNCSAVLGEILSTFTAVGVFR